MVRALRSGFLYGCRCVLTIYTYNRNDRREMWNVCRHRMNGKQANTQRGRKKRKHTQHNASAITTNSEQSAASTQYSAHHIHIILLYCFAHFPFVNPLQWNSADSFVFRWKMLSRINRTIKIIIWDSVLNRICNESKQIISKTQFICFSCMVNMNQNVLQHFTVNKIHAHYLELFVRRGVHRIKVCVCVWRWWFCFTAEISTYLNIEIIVIV